MRYNKETMTPKKILIIEDSAELADSLEDMLILKGYNALKATTGKQGLTMAATENPDLILLDLKLPDIEGFEILRRLRASEATENVRVLILTASDTIDGTPVDIEIKPEDILHKPHWGIVELAERVEEELKTI
jgi:DNA-binding response OmpR family regulator